MKKNMLLTIGTILFVLCNASAQLSSFDSTAQGWTGGFNLTHYDSLGNPGGYIESGPQQGDFFWNAPSNYLGNKTSCIGSYLSFDSKSTAIQLGTSFSGVKFTGHGLTIYTPRGAASYWNTETFLLDASGAWLKDSASSYGLPATTADFQLVFDSLSQFQILGGDSNKPYYSSLDNVNLCTTMTSTKENFNTQHEISIFPNPTNGIINLDGISNETIIVYNSLGAKLKELKNENKIDLSSCSAGIYFVQVVNSRGKIISNAKVLRQ